MRCELKLGVNDVNIETVDMRKVTKIEVDLQDFQIETI